MRKIIEEIKNKKFLFFALAAIVVLIAVFFIIFAAINNKKKSGNPAVPPPKEKTMDEIINDLSAPAKAGETPTPVPQKVIDSLTAPAAAIKPSAAPVAGSKKNKAAKPTSAPTPAPAPVSKDVINSLTAPAK